MERPETTDYLDESASCFGRDCRQGAFNTATETNRLILFGATMIIALAGFVVMEESASYLTGSLLFQIYTDVRRLGVILSLTSGVLMLVAFIGFLGAYWKNKVLIKSFMMLTLLLVVAQFLISSFLYYAQDGDQLRVLAESEFKRNWIELIRFVVTGQDTDGEVRSFIAQIQSQGECCGYDLVDDVHQNPVDEIQCAFQQPCKEYFQVFAAQDMYPIFVGYLVLNIVVFCVLAISVLATCGYIPKPSVQYSDGAFYKAAPLSERRMIGDSESLCLHEQVVVSLSE